MSTLRTLLSTAIVTGHLLTLPACSLKQREYAFAPRPTPVPYSGQVGYGPPPSYGPDNYAMAQYQAHKAHCDELTATFQGLAAAAAGGAVLAGSSGTIAGMADDKNARLGLAIGSGVVGAFSAIALTVSQLKGERFQRECPLNPN